MIPAGDPAPGPRPPTPARPRGGWLRRWHLAGRLHEVLHLDDEPRKIAGGLAAGVFIAFSPYYGVHTLLALAAAFVFRLNVAATVFGSWVVIPPAIPFVMAFCLNVGWALVGRPVRRRPIAKGVSALALWSRLSRHLWPLVVGTTVVGLAAALVAYVVTYQAVLRVRAARARHAQVGESTPSVADFQLDKPERPV